MHPEAILQNCKLLILIHNFEHYSMWSVFTPLRRKMSGNFTANKPGKVGNALVANTYSSHLTALRALVSSKHYTVNVYFTFNRHLKDYIKIEILLKTYLVTVQITILIMDAFFWVTQNKANK
uniref:Uncharacterized protein n=1 Tax=Glossina pallidipes TaxID=7398 RepID=A0A1A9Z244_GLOPL